MPDLSPAAASAFVAAAGLEFEVVGGTRVAGWIDLGRQHHTLWGVTRAADGKELVRGQVRLQNVDLPT